MEVLADDAAVCAKFDDLKQSLQQVFDEEPKYGFYPEPKNNFLFIQAMLMKPSVSLSKPD